MGAGFLSWTPFFEKRNCVDCGPNRASESGFRWPRRAHRTRLLLEVCEAVAREVGPGRTGVRLSALTSAGDVADSHPQSLFNRAVERIASLELAHIHVIEGETGGDRQPEPFDYQEMRRPFRGAWIVNNGYDRTLTIDAIASGKADLVAFGREFLAKPDLPRRLREDASLNEPNQKTFYGGGAEGHTDYPALD
ncbi:MAG: hypothetical protein ABI767_05070 [Rhodanobacter sp.]